MTRLALIALAAVAYALAAPPWSLDALAPVALAPLFFALRGLSSVRGAVVGFGFGMLGAALVSWWTVPMIDRFFGSGLAIGVVASLGIWLATAGIPIAIFGAVAARLLAGRPRVAYLGVPAAWVGAEFLRTHLFTGLPWELIGHALYRRLALIQVADVTGAYGLSFLCAATALVAGDLCRRRQGRTPAVAMGIVLTAWAGLYGYGVWRLAAFGAPAADTLSVALVQANRAPTRSLSPVAKDATLVAYLDLTRADVATRAPELIVWPENTVGYSLDRGAEPLGLLSRLARDTGATLLVGGPRDEGETATHNSAYAIDASGVRGTHDKTRLVPFAEYVPFGFGLLGAPAATLTPGESMEPVSTPRGPLGVLICYELLYPRLARDLVLRGARVLVNVANDAWFDPTGTAAGRQVFSMAVFRAVETRRWVLRAATTGVSGAIEPTGHPQARIEAGVAGVLRTDVGLSTVLTPYVRLGDVFAWACVLAALGSLTAGRRARCAA